MSILKILPDTGDGPRVEGFSVHPARAVDRSMSARSASTATQARSGRVTAVVALTLSEGDWRPPDADPNHRWRHGSWLLVAAIEVN